MRRNHLPLFLVLLIFVECSPNVPANPFVGNLPSLTLQEEKELDKWNKKKTENFAEYEKIEQKEADIHKKYLLKKLDEKKRLSGTQIPCFAAENELLFVDDGIATAECSGDSFTYRAKIAYRKVAYGNMVFDVIFANAQDEPIVVYKQIMFHPESAIGKFKPGEDYYLKIHLYSFGEDPLLYQKEFAKIILIPVL